MKHAAGHVPWKAPYLVHASSVNICWLCVPTSAVRTEARGPRARAHTRPQAPIFGLKLPGTLAPPLTRHSSLSASVSSLVKQYSSLVTWGWGFYEHLSSLCRQLSSQADQGPGGQGTWAGSSLDEKSCNPGGLRLPTYTTGVFTGGTRGSLLVPIFQDTLGWQSFFHIHRESSNTHRRCSRNRC